MKDLITTILNGFSMSLADSVPGVSGGTVAFILGFYDKFINSLNTLISKDKNKKEALIYLIKLGIGWGIGIIIATLILSSLFEKHIYPISSLFLGFIIFAIPLIIKSEKDIIKGKYKYLIFTLIGILIVFLITYFNPTSGNELSVEIGNLNIGLCLFVFLAGMIAISAMVLPGISGSTLLLIFGLYVPIINAVKETIHFNLSYLPVLVIFGLGVITGAFLTIKLVKKALTNYRSQTIYTIIGLMLGSIYSIVLGPTSIGQPQLTLTSFSILFFIIGSIIVIGLELIRTKK